MQASLDQITKHIIDNNEIHAPESLVDNTIENAVARMNAKLPKKLQLKASDPKVSENYKADAVRSVQTMLALKQIAQQEKLEVKQDEVNKEMFDYAYQNKIDLRKLLSQADKSVYDQFAHQAITKKVISLILNSSKVDFVSKEAYDALNSPSLPEDQAESPSSK
jgi:trigger factor